MTLGVLGHHGSCHWGINTLFLCFLQAVNSDFRAGWGDDGEEKDLLFESESKQTG